MGLQITETSGIQGMEVFQSKNLEDVPGGLTLDQTNNNFDEGVVVQKGELIIYDESTRLAVVDKLATVHATVGDTDVKIQVKKGHCLSVGDVIAEGDEGGAAYAITEIDTSDDDYDNVTVDTALGVLSAGDVLWLSAATGATKSEYLGTPNGVLKNDCKPSANDAVSVVTRGTVYERRLPGIYGGYGVPSGKKSAMSDRILFSDSF